MTCRQMGIEILPPDVNLGGSYGFTVDGGSYPLWAVSDQECGTTGDRSSCRGA